MRRSVADWFVDKIAQHRPVTTPEPIIPAEGDDEATVGINKSIESLNDAHNRRPHINAVVDSLAKHRNANNFGEKLDQVFVQVATEKRKK